jgi:outer membrane protein assembly factor BamB
LLVACSPWASRARGQPRGIGFGPAPGARFELSDNVQLDRADNTVRTRLDRVGEYLADGQWEEAVETLLEVMEQSGGKLLGVSEQRFVSVRDYCHLQLASLPEEALRLYRSRVDPSARQWYEQAIRRRDRRLLEKVVEEAFASSWGDDALYALGEMAMESGDHAAARAYWEKLVPHDPPEDEPPTWLGFPDTDLDLAAVRARQVLASILEGALARARNELEALERSYPDARGRFGGREVNYVKALSSLLSESADWPGADPDPDWPTFAGSPLRNKIARESVDVAEVAWRVPLRPTMPGSAGIAQPGAPVLDVAEDHLRPLSHHPVLVGDLVLANSLVEIVAVELETGRPAWGMRGPQIYRDGIDEEVQALYRASTGLGVPRFTMTVFHGNLYARMGPPGTSRPRARELSRGVGYLLCLDLAAEGRLRWRVEPPESIYAFDGAPVADETNLYVAMRRSDVQPQAHVACFEASTGRLRWQQFLCAAETRARGMFPETTHNLLTLHRDTLYVNTNLGAVAALSTRDGKVKWVSLYPRVLKGDLLKPAPHRCRDLNPCLYHRGTLVVAPADSRRIFVLDAANGQILGQTGPEVEDVVHLLGVSGDTLIASGDRIYWIGLTPDEEGNLRRKHVWPLGNEKLGYGRGVLAGDCVLWPTRKRIYLFDQQTGKQKKEISLVGHGVLGGNLLVAPGYLIIAGSEALVALRLAGARSDEPEPKTDRIAFTTDS